jgi:SNF2 family DNA or RNA helicase
MEGLNWLYKLYQANLNGILADEMGLGKTIQSIAILALVESLRTKANDIDLVNEVRENHHIVIVPKITLGKWRKEITEWFPAVRLFYFYGSNDERNVQREELR